VAPAERGAAVRVASALVAALALAACTLLPSSSATPSASASPSARPTSPAASPSASEAPSASPTPAPSLSLDPPPAADPRQVAVTVTPEVTAEGGRIVVTVTSRADTMVDELVLRWPTALADHLLLAPFEPSEERIRENGPPLVQPWTKWVVGPGERGEPAGTTSLGWGPLLAGATLEIPILVTRAAPGPVSFDLQLLAGEGLLTLEDERPAELRIEVP
jgi:hypothetical protein